MADIQHKTVAPIGEDERSCRPSVQWLLERVEDRRTPIHRHNRLEVIICGELAFASIAKDIRKAKGSVDIICWGFDPAMEVVRGENANVWPRGETWGELLEAVAAGRYNDKRPVQVRLLVWYSELGNKATNNMPGYRRGADYELKQAASRGMGAALTPGGSAALPPQPAPTDPKDQREVFNAHWYRDAFGGKLGNLSIRLRDGDRIAVFNSLKNETAVDLSEFGGMEIVPTDHQKTILIDYEHDGGADAVGYVMGLNSVTDYWDTQEHKFNQPRRGAAWEGAGDSEPGLKPYQDYACRIEGDALVSVSKNFGDAWNRAKGMGAALARTHDVHNPPAGLTAKLGPTGQNALIVRTQPEEDDKSIKRLYAQAGSFARQYIYVENQYFQHTEWAQQLKTERKAVVTKLQSSGKGSPVDVPNLHVIVVIPTPERAQMVPRTYDTVKALGQGSSMPNQDKAVDDELKRHAQEQAEWDRKVSMQSSNTTLLYPNAGPQPLSAIAQSAKDQGAKETVATELNTLGMRTLVASLWTFDRDYERSQRTQIAQFEASKATAVKTQHYRQMNDKMMRGRYREIYIHSKLMIIDDAMFTLGSANLNLRSMAVDAELNIASDDPACSADLRRRVWRLHSHEADGCDGGSGSSSDVADTFEKWRKLILENSISSKSGEPPKGFLFPFEDKRTSWIRLG